jgi:hypothetical protein
MTSLVPSLAQIAEIWIGESMGPVAPFSSRRLLVLQCSINTAGTDPDEACNVLFSVASPRHLPDLLVATNAPCLAVPAFPFD